MQGMTAWQWSDMEPASAGLESNAAMIQLLYMGCV